MLKKEVQKTIIKKEFGSVSEDEFLSILKIVAPGTNLRTALDGILKGGKGALIVVQNERLFPLMDGGFRINAKFTPQKLIELSKMDGAIILSYNLKRIEYANVLLTPDNIIKTEETGTRHKAAERTAKQIGTFVIAISERRNEITVFYKDKRYVLKKTDEIFDKVNKYLQIIEKQRELFDNLLHELNKSELSFNSDIALAMQLIQKGKLIQKVAEEMKRPMIELGKDGALLRTHLKELVSDIEKETNLVIKDYAAKSFKKSRDLLNSLNYDELLEKEKIMNALFYDKVKEKVDIKGWRILFKTNIAESEIAKIFEDTTNLKELFMYRAIHFEKILGKERAEKFVGDLEKIKVKFSNSNSV